MFGKQRGHGSLLESARAAILTLALAGCTLSAAAPTPTSSTAPVKLTVATAASSAELALYRTAVGEFRTSFPNYTVEFNVSPDVLTLMQRLLAGLATGEPPDILDLGNEWYAPLIAQNALLYARPLITSPYLPELASIFRAEQSPVLTGQRPLQDSLETICARFDSILAQRGGKR